MARDAETDLARAFAEHRDRLVGVAYRLLGSVADAEDVVQDAWLRWSRADRSDVVDARGYLVRVTTRLAIDRLRRVKAHREDYVGSWLPEPLVTAADVEAQAELAESVSMAMLLILETLSPLERAVFVLREAFAMPYAEIAEILDRNEPAVRQLARRARDHVRARQPRFDTDPGTRREVTDRFLTASMTGDLPGLMAVLAPSVRLITDSGGRVRAPRLVVEGADKVARFLVATSGRPLPDLVARTVTLNGGPGIVIASQGEPVAVVSIDVQGGRIATIYLMANPDKLAAVRGLVTH